MLRTRFRIGIAVLLTTFGFAATAPVASANESVANYGCLISQNHGALQPSSLAPGQIGVAPLLVKYDENGNVVKFHYPNTRYAGAWAMTCLKGNGSQP